MSQRAALLLLAGLALVPSAVRSLGEKAQPLDVRSTEDTAPADRVLYGERIDLNRADAAALELIPGVGPTLARRIVEDRAGRGDFRSVEEVERVRGIGPAKRRLIAEWVSVGAATIDRGR